MALEVVIWVIPGHRRSLTVCHAMAAGIDKLGDRAVIRPSVQYQRPTTATAFFYGAAGRLANAIDDYAEAGGKAVYADLGYFGRHNGGRFEGYHKLVVNGRHPTQYFQAVRHDFGRAASLGVKIRPWRKTGRHILIAAMGPKGAQFEGFRHGEWETRAAMAMCKVSGRPIAYRSKPNDPLSYLPPGCVPMPRNQSLEEALANAHAIVSHHSNANVEAILMGVPSFTAEGPAAAMGLTDLAMVDSPVYARGRTQWAADLAWTQFSVDEMREGIAWRHLKDEGLVP